MYAPFDGIITYLNHPFIGVYSTAGSIEAEIIDPKTMFVEVLADQSEVIKLFESQKVNITLDSFDDKMYEGKVTTISFAPTTGENGSSYAVKISFVGVDLPTSRFKIGMTGDVKFIVSEKENTLYVPSGFVNTDKGGKFIQTDKKGNKLYVEIGLESEENTEVMGNGVSEGRIVYD